MIDSNEEMMYVNGYDSGYSNGYNDCKDEMEDVIESMAIEIAEHRYGICSDFISSLEVERIMKEFVRK